MHHGVRWQRRAFDANQGSRSKVWAWFITDTVCLIKYTFIYLEYKKSSWKLECVGGNEKKCL